MVAHAASHSVQGAEAEAGRAPLGLQREVPGQLGLRAETQPQKENESAKERKRMEGGLWG